MRSIRAALLVWYGNSVMITASRSGRPLPSTVSIAATPRIVTEPRPVV